MSRKRSWMTNPELRLESEAELFDELALPVRERGGAKLLIGRRE